MATTDIQGGSFYNLLSVHPLMKDNKFNQPCRNMFNDNLMMTDAVVQQANELLGHTGSYQTYTGVPEAIKVGAFRGSTSAAWGTFKDDISIFSDASIIPKDVADLHSKTWVGEEENTKANSFMKGCETHLIYGTSGPTTDTVGGVTPTAAAEKYTGLAARFRVPDNADGTYGPMNPDPSTAAQKGVWSAGASGTQTTSIWFIRWGKRAASLITPMNDPQYGMKIEDLGLQMAWVVDSTTHESAKYRRCWMKEYEYKHGLSIYPGENGGNHVARLRNINTSLSFNNSGLRSQIYQIIEEYFLRSTDGVMMYVPPRLMTIFDILYESKPNIQFTTENPYALSPENWAGKVFLRTCRNISTYETAVAPV